MKRTPDGRGAGKRNGDGRGASGEGGFLVCGEAVAPGGRRTVRVPVSELYNGDPLYFHVTVVRGKAPGPTLFVMAALHGDEIAGVEVIRRLSRRVDEGELRGTLLLVPIGNPFGFLQRSRYMPDRGDLNRSFPGSASGSATARMADFLMREVVARSDHGIELHTAAARRRNVPQVRADFRNPRVRRLAEAFGCPYLIDSKPPARSIRAAADARKTSVILYETGEILRINEECVRTGLDGCLNVLRFLEMLPPAGKPAPAGDTQVFRHMTWVRAEHGGLLEHRVDLERRVPRGGAIATVVSPVSGEEHEITAPRAGTVVGLTTLPLVNPGDAVCHLAW